MRKTTDGRRCAVRMRRDRKGAGAGAGGAGRSEGRSEACTKGHEEEMGRRTATECGEQTMRTRTNNDCAGSNDGKEAVAVRGEELDDVHVVWHTCDRIENEVRHNLKLEMRYEI